MKSGGVDVFETVCGGTVGPFVASGLLGRAYARIDVLLRSMTFNFGTCD